MLAPTRVTTTPAAAAAIAVAGALSLAGAVTPRAASAQAPAADRSAWLGVRGALFLPADADVRRAFGDAVPALGVAVVGAPRPGSTRLFPSLELAGAVSGRERFIVVPLTLAVEHQLAVARAKNVPYLRADAGIGYFDYRVARGPAAAGDTARARRGGAVGAAELGLIVNRWLRGGVRYRLCQRLDGIDFGGVELGLTVGAIRVF